MTNRTWSGPRAQTVDEQHRALPRPQPGFLRTSPAAARAHAPAAHAHRFHRLAGRAPGGSAARESTERSAEARRIRRRGARQRRARRTHPSLHAPPAARAHPRGRRCSTLEAGLREDFDAFHSVLVLTRPVAAARDVEPSRSCASCRPTTPTSAAFEALLATGKPRCGQVRDTQRDFLFGPESGRASARWRWCRWARSGALGLLALGSAERERFHPGMSTEFLKRMGELITDALSRT